MNFKDVQEKFTKLKVCEDQVTLSKLSSVFTKKPSSIDLSNYFLFKKSAKSLVNSLARLLCQKNSLKCLVLQNCMISAETLMSLLKTLSKQKSCLETLDLSNNRLKLDPSHARLISKIFSCNNRGKCLMIRGNNSNSPSFFRELYSQDVNFRELDFYDSGLTPDCLLTLSKILSLNKKITKLNLGYNSEAFNSYVNVSTFALSVSENSYIQKLILSENESLSHPEALRQLCDGLKGSISIIHLDLAGINFLDSGLQTVSDHLLRESSLTCLNISNNEIQDAGLDYLCRHFPSNLCSLDLSYNTFSHPDSVYALGELLKKTKSLRKLNISHSFELEDFSEDLADFFCDCIMKNDSLSKLKCEGFKVPIDPEVICKKLRTAIEIRQLSLSYKFSALNSTRVKSSEDSVVSNDFSVKLISKVPSSIWNYRDSATHTEKKEFVDSPNQEPIITTSKQITFLSTYE